MRLALFLDHLRRLRHVNQQVVPRRLVLHLAATVGHNERLRVLHHSFVIPVSLAAPIGDHVGANHVIQFFLLVPHRPRVRRHLVTVFVVAAGVDARILIERAVVFHVDVVAGAACLQWLRLPKLQIVGGREEHLLGLIPGMTCKAVGLALGGTDSLLAFPDIGRPVRERTLLRLHLVVREAPVAIP